MTLETLGQATGIGYKHIAAVERGEKVPSFDAIDKLAEALGVRLFEFFLPSEMDEAALNQSLRKLMHAVDADGSPALKRFLVVTLSLLRHVETH